MFHLSKIKADIIYFSYIVKQISTLCQWICFTKKEKKQKNPPIAADIFPMFSKDERMFQFKIINKKEDVDTPKSSIFDSTEFYSSELSATVLRLP
jgi:hypothetical protein